MKLILIAFAVLALALGAGALSAYFVTRTMPQPAREAVVTAYEPVPAAAAPAQLDDAIVREEMALLRAEVAALAAEVERLREGTGRTPAIAAAPAEESATQAAPRDAILQVIEEDRQARERKQQEERDQREMAQLLQRSERIANEVGLDATQHKALTDVLVLERQKIAELRARYREGGDMPPTDFREVRDEIQSTRAWRTEELTKRLGADLASKIETIEDSRWRRSFGRGAQRTTIPTPGGG